MYTAYILMGGNEGNVPLVFRKAISLMIEYGLHITAKGSLYKSAAWGDEVQGAFYNRLLVLQTSLEPQGLLSVLLEIESKLGRKRQAGVISSRSIDIDILFVDDLIISRPGLSVPHPRLHLRKFVLVPLCELVPDMIHPVTGKTMKQLLSDTPDQLMVVKVKQDRYPDVSPIE